LIWEGAGEEEANAAGIADHHSPELEQAHADRFDVTLGDVATTTWLSIAEASLPGLSRLSGCMAWGMA
jgi:hypothetical protein